MFERLADLDELALRCRSERAKSYIAEAIASYRAGAYRACIVTTWIAVVYDIIDKIRDLGLSGDSIATDEISRLNNLLEIHDRGDQTVVEKILKFERGVLELARDKFTLLDRHQFIDLSRLRDDRNRCAHPTFQRHETPYQPAAELARFHLRNCIEHLLSQPPVQGKVALDELVRRVTAEYFPTDTAKAKVALVEGPFAQPTASLVRAFVDRLIYGLFEKESPLWGKARAMSALHAVIELQRPISEPRLLHQLNRLIGKFDGAQLSRCILLLSQMPECCESLDISNKEILRKFILIEPSSLMMEVLAIAGGIRCLLDAVKERINMLDEEALAQLIKYGETELTVNRSVELFSMVKNWHHANTVFSKLVFPVMKYITRHHVQKVFLAASEKRADLEGSAGFNNFLGLLIGQSTYARDELLSLLNEHNLDFSRRMIEHDENFGIFGDSIHN